MNRSFSICLSILLGVMAAPATQLDPLGIATNIHTVVSTNRFNQQLVWSVTNVASIYQPPSEYDLLNLPGFVPVWTNGILTFRRDRIWGARGTNELTATEIAERNHEWNCEFYVPNNSSNTGICTYLQPGGIVLTQQFVHACSDVWEVQSKGYTDNQLRYRLGAVDYEADQFIYTEPWQVWKYEAEYTVGGAWKTNGIPIWNPQDEYNNIHYPENLHNYANWTNVPVLNPLASRLQTLSPPAHEIITFPFDFTTGSNVTLFGSNSVEFASSASDAWGHLWTNVYYAHVQPVRSIGRSGYPYVRSGVTFTIPAGTLDPNAVYHPRAWMPFSFTNESSGVVYGGTTIIDKGKFVTATIDGRGENNYMCIPDGYPYAIFPAMNGIAEEFEVSIISVDPDLATPGNGSYPGASFSGRTVENMALLGLDFMKYDSRRAVFSKIDMLSSPPVFERNTNCYAWGVADLTPFPVANNEGMYHTKIGGLITRQDLLQTEHWHCGIGTEIYFVDNSNNLITRTVESLGFPVDGYTYPSSSLDLCIVHLDEPLPPGIKHCKVFPPDAERFLGGCGLYKIPAFNINQAHLLTVLLLEDWEHGYSLGATDIPWYSPTNFYGHKWMAQPCVTYATERYPYGTDAMRSGDSCSPVFIHVDNIPVMLWAYNTRHFGPSPKIHYDAINQTLEDLGSNYRLDPLNLEAGTYGIWAANLKVDGESDDPDGDGVANLYEYGLGGDPNDPADKGHPISSKVVFENGTNWLEVVHARRLDSAEVLEYSLKAKSDLTSGNWTNDSPWEVGTETNDANFEMASFRFETTNETKFIKLNIESL